MIHDEEEYFDYDKEYPYCSNCGEDEDFSFLYARASTDWYKCNHCNEETQVSNI